MSKSIFICRSRPIMCEWQRSMKMGNFRDKVYWFVCYKFMQIVSVGLDYLMDKVSPFLCSIHTKYMWERLIYYECYYACTHKFCVCGKVCSPFMCWRNKKCLKQHLAFVYSFIPMKMDILYTTKFNSLEFNMCQTTYTSLIWGLGQETMQTLSWNLAKISKVSWDHAEPGAIFYMSQ